MALKAEEEPRNMQPKITTRAVVSIRAFRGRPQRPWTRAKTREKGRPPSLWEELVGGEQWKGKS